MYRIRDILLLMAEKTEKQYLDADNRPIDPPIELRVTPNIPGKFLEEYKGFPLWQMPISVFGLIPDPNHTGRFYRTFLEYDIQDDGTDALTWAKQCIDKTEIPLEDPRVTILKKKG